MGDDMAQITTTRVPRNTWKGRTCSVEGCTETVLCKELCSGHYWRLAKLGDVRANQPIIRLNIPLEEKIWGRIDKNGPSHKYKPELGQCWIWTGQKQRGQGLVAVKKERFLVHRVVYELFKSKIPEGLEIDHICHNEDKDCAGGESCIHRACCNPDHLEAVTRRTNQIRGLSPVGINYRKTHCVHGHEFTPENTKMKNGCRYCITCERINSKIRKNPEYYAWRKAVYKRDNYTCVECGECDGELHAHHIKSWADYPELRYDIDNGQTLCEDCHKKTENYGRRRKAKRVCV